MTYLVPTDVDRIGARGVLLSLLGKAKVSYPYSNRSNPSRIVYVDTEDARMEFTGSLWDSILRMLAELGYTWSLNEGNVDKMLAHIWRIP